MSPLAARSAPPSQAALSNLQISVFVRKRPMLPFEIKEFVEDLLGVTIRHDPQMDKQAFLRDVREALAKVPPVLHPISLQARPWLNVDKLERAMQPQQQCVLL